MPTDNIEEIKNKIDVVDLIQEYIQLKPAGTNNFKANCPFHHEKTPSFMVSRDKQIWHCFGCGEGGDIFGFLMKMEGLEFPEALRILAKKAGVQLQYRDPALQNQKTKLLDVCKAAANFYHKILLDHPKAQFVRNYLKERRVGEDTMETFNLGYAPEAWDTLNKYLVQRGFKEEDIFLAGLTVKKERGVGYNDRFRNRLMFAINDVHGNVIGFGGRWLGQEEKVAKYINSPQTLVYNKSYVVYGLDKAKQAIKERKQAVIVEGYMDCLASHQAGVKNVVASSGTALTQSQLKLIKRFTRSLAFAFDQDIAGEDASRRGIDIAWQEEMETKIISLPQGVKDPDELIKQEPQKWPAAIAKAQSIMDYYFDSTLSKADLSKVEDKKAVAKTLLTVIVELADPIEQTHYLQQLAEALRVDEEVLRDKLRQIVGKKAVVKSETTADKLPQHDRFISLAEIIIGLVLQYPDNLNYIIDQLLPEHLPSDKLQRLYKKLIIHYTKKQTFQLEDFIKSFPAADRDLTTYVEVLLLKVDYEFKDVEDEIVQREIASGIKELKKRFVQQRLKQVEDKLRQAEKDTDERSIDKYTQEFTELTSELNQIK